VKELLDAGADPSGTIRYMAYHVNMSGYKEEKCLAATRLLVAHDTVIAELRSGRTDIGMMRGETPLALHFTARWCKFVGKCARNAYGEPVARTGALDMALLLAENGARLDVRDSAGRLYYEPEQDDSDWDENWNEGMRPSEVKKAVEKPRRSTDRSRRRLQQRSHQERRRSERSGSEPVPYELTHSEERGTARRGMPQASLVSFSKSVGSHATREM